MPDVKHEAPPVEKHTPTGADIARHALELSEKHPALWTNAGKHGEIRKCTLFADRVLRDLRLPLPWDATHIPSVKIYSLPGTLRLFMSCEVSFIMAMPNPERASLDQVLKLVDQLSPNELAQLRQKIDSKSCSAEWQQLQDEVEQNRIAKELPPLSEEEIYAEFTEHRREQRAKRAQSSH